MKENRVLELYKKLHKKYGNPQGQWILWCKRPKTEKGKNEVIIGAILTQRTNWKNVELCLTQMGKLGIFSLQDIYDLGEKDSKKLAELIRPSGFYQNKAHYLFEIAQFFMKNGGLEKISQMPLEDLRKSLLDLSGIGPETADSILLYALEKPVFVIDEYTRRLVIREHLANKLSYDYLQKLFEDSLPEDYKLYQDFHALIVIDGKNSFK